MRLQHWNILASSTLSGSGTSGNKVRMPGWKSTIEPLRSALFCDVGAQAVVRVHELPRTTRQVLMTLNLYLATECECRVARQ